MCLISFRWQPAASLPLVLLAHRDEYFARPTAPLHRWADDSGICAGRDLQAGGSWLGVRVKGANLRLAALTNIREKSSHQGLRTRGELVSDFLRSDMSPAQFCAEFERRPAAGAEYNGFNLLVFAHDELWLLSNRAAARQLVPGLYGLSNGALDAPWPKTLFAKRQLQALLDDHHHDNGHGDEPDLLTEGLFNKGSAPTLGWLERLRDRSQPDDHLLPDTGIGLDKERWLAPAFIQSSAASAFNYGTRSGHLFSLQRSGHWQLAEREYAPHTGAIHASRRVHGQLTRA